MANSDGSKVQRRLAAILAADVVGFSTLMGQDEEGTLERVKSLRRDVIEPRVEAHQGRVVKITGDGFLIEFSSPVEAVRCAREVQEALAAKNPQEPNQALQVRIGINLGDIIIEGDGDIYGDGVNVAARLEQIAEPGSIWVSGKVYEEVRDKLPYGFKDRGEQQVKNISRPVRIYSLFLYPDGTRSDLAAKALPILPEKPSIAVLPFTNLSGDREQDYFADGITEDIIIELPRISAFLVITRNSTFTYKGAPVDVKQVGRDLSVQYVLEGSVRRLGNRVRIAAQLVEADNGAHIWAEKYDRELAELFDVQDEVTRSVVASTQTQVVLNEGLLAERNQSIGFRIWDLTKRAWREMYQLTQESLERARSIGQVILEHDQASAKGHQVIAAADYHLVWMGFAADRDQMRHEALHQVRDAIRLDDRDEYSQWTYGNILAMLFGRYDEAVSAYREALEINPNFSLAYGSLGTALSLSGDADESIRNVEISIRLNPRDPSLFFRYSALAMAHFAKGDYLKAKEWALRTIARRSNWWLAHAVLVASLSHLGDNSSAQEALHELLAIQPDRSLSTLPLPPMHRDQLNRLRQGLLQAGMPA